MTFELSEQHQAVRDRARDYATRLQDRSAMFDRDGMVPTEVTREITELTGNDGMSLVIAVEEVAAASAAAAATTASSGGDALDLTGLRGVRAIDDSPRAQLTLAAVALGIARAALVGAIEELRPAKATSGGEEKPHWVVADVATEIEAARLLVYKAAASGNAADGAVARLLAASAAEHAVQAAIRVTGVAALRAGSVLERLSRDVRALAVIGGTEEDHRAAAAEGLLPQ